MTSVSRDPRASMPDWVEVSHRAMNPDTASLGVSALDKKTASAAKSISTASTSSNSTDSGPDVAIPMKGVFKETTKEVLPLVFGSTTLNPLTAEPGNPSERCSVKAAKLGKDLQYIFAPSAAIEKVTNFCQGQRLENSVKVIDNSDLQEAILLNRIAAPYLCDIVSRKKLKALTIF